MSQRRHRGRSAAVRAAVACAVTTLALAEPAAAVDKSYVGPASGAGAVWNSAGNWNPVGVPGSGDNARLVNADSTSRTVTLDLPSTSITQIRVGNAGLGTNSITQPNTVNVAFSDGLWLAAGANEKAVYTQQGGSNTFGTGGFTGVFSIGEGTGSNATYNLQGGSIYLSHLLGNLSVGLNGTGAFNQSGGSVDLEWALIVGQNAGSVGHYTLGAGTFDSVNQFIGLSGSGTFTQTGGTNQFNGMMMIARMPGSSGTYSLSGGTINATAQSVYVGGDNNVAGGAGVLNVSGGGHAQIFGTLKVWNTAGSAINLSGGTITAASLDTGGNPSRFTWTGGTLNLTGAGGLSIAAAGPLGATLGLDAAKALNVTNTLTVAGGGTLNVTGGTPTAGAVTIASGGTVNLAAGTLEAGTVSLTGTLTGGGTVNSLVTVNSGGTVSPGTGGAGAITIGGLTLTTGAKITFDNNDRIDVTAPNALNISGLTGATLTGAPANGATLLTYAGALGGSVNNLKFVGGPVGTEYRARNNAAAHAIEVATRRAGAHAATARTGNPAPGAAGGTLSVFNFGPALNDAGVIAFGASISGSTPTSNSGLFRHDGAALTKIVRHGEAVPGGGQYGDGFSGNGTPNMNASGRVAFSSGIGNGSGVFVGDGSTPTTIARTGQSAPGIAGGTFANVFGTPGINAAGQTSFFAIVSVGTSFTSGIYRADGTTLVSIAREGLSAPGTGGGTFGELLNDGVIGENGSVAFTSYTSSTTNRQGIFRHNGTSLSAIMRTGTAAPGGGTYDNNIQLAAPRLNDLGHAAFYAGLTGTTGTSGLFRDNGFGFVTAVARPGQAAPGTGGGTFGGFGYPEINNAGQVAFSATIDGGAANERGIFRSDGTTTIPIMRANDPAPGSGGGTFSTFIGGQNIAFNEYAILAGGQVACRAEGLLNTAGGSTDNGGIFLGDGQETIAAVRRGQVVEGNVITGLGFAGQKGVNDFGQIAYRANFSGGAAGHYVFTPTLHWRSAGGGSWDTNTNWTVGLAPAHVHEVVIDPSAALTVTGPSTGRTVKSLTIGGGGAATTLQLPSGGNVTLKTSQLAIDTAGGSRLAMADNDLIVDYTGASVEGAIRLLVKQGRNSGTGITSAPGTPVDDKVLAVADNAAWGKSAFNNINIDSSTVVGKYTYFGDSNLDGMVTGDDYLAVDSNLGIGNSWLEGDFNMDDSVTGDDYLAIDTNLGKGTSNPLAYAELKVEMVARHVAMFGEEYLVKLAEVEANGFAVVPEPGAAAAGVMSFAGLLLCRRRGRRPGDNNAVVILPRFISARPSTLFPNSRNNFPSPGIGPVATSIRGRPLGHFGRERFHGSRA